MASKVISKVSVSKLGVVLHSHAGCEYAHDPNRAHDRSTEMHDALTRKALLAPDGLDKLTPAQRFQFTSALRTAEESGKTFWVYKAKAATLAADVGPAPVVEAPELTYAIDG